MSFNAHVEEEDDGLYDQVCAMADRMQLKGPKRQEYIHDHMLQGGYEPVQSRESYAKARRADDEGDQGGGGTRSWFGSSAGTRRTGGRSRDEDDQY